MSDGPIYPFHCGSQFSDWQDRNCYRCTKFDAENYSGECELDLALFEALMGDGSVSPAIAERIGYNEQTANAYGWDCPERVLRAPA